MVSCSSCSVQGRPCLVDSHNSRVRCRSCASQQSSCDLLSWTIRIVSDLVDDVARAEAELAQSGIDFLYCIDEELEPWKPLLEQEAFLKRQRVDLVRLGLQCLGDDANASPTVAEHLGVEPPVMDLADPSGSLDTLLACFRRLADHGVVVENL